MINILSLWHFVFVDTIQSRSKNWQSRFRVRRVLPCLDSVRFVQTSCRISVPGASSGSEQKVHSNFLRDRQLVPESDPPSAEDVKYLYQFFNSRFLLDVLIYVLLQTLILCKTFLLMTL